MNYAEDVYRTKRRDAEFAEKNPEIKEGVIEKKLSVCLCGLSDMRFVDFIHRQKGQAILNAFDLDIPSLIWLMEASRGEADDEIFSCWSKKERNLLAMGMQSGKVL